MKIWAEDKVTVMILIMWGLMALAFCPAHCDEGQDMMDYYKRQAQIESYKSVYDSLIYERKYFQNLFPNLTEEQFEQWEELINQMEKLYNQIWEMKQKNETLRELSR